MKNKKSLLSFLLIGVLAGCTPATSSSSSSSHSSSSSEDPSVHVHNMEYHEAEEGTCLVEGTVAYYYCESCDNYYADENGDTLLSDLSSGYGAHQFGEWIDEVEANCLEDGVLGHKDCLVCEKHFDEEGNEISDLVIHNHGGHNYVVDEVINEPTTTSEGLVRFVCNNTNCGETYTLKTLCLPALSLNGKQLEWSSVEGAEGYNLISDGTALDLGNITSIVITDYYLTREISVQAYTSNTEYYLYGASEFALTKGSVNLLDDYNGDFELDEVVVKANSQWQHAPYGNFTNQDWWVISENDGNMAAKMGLNSGFVSSDTELWTVGVHKDIGPNMMAAGTYTITFDYKLSEVAASNSETRTIFANINHPTGFNAVDFVSLAGKEANVWHHAEVNVTKAFTSWQQLVMFYHTNVKTDASVEDYILIDNIEVHQEGENTNIDNLGDGTFETFKTTGISTESDKGKWICANTLYIENDGVGTGIVIEEDGNQALKIYSEQECASVSMRFNPSIAQSGFYYLSLDIKLGSASQVHNTGFRAFSDGAQVINDTQIDPTNLSSEEYTRFEFVISTSGNANAAWMNFFMWAFANNNTTLDSNNYILVDNISVFSATL